MNDQDITEWQQAEAALRASEGRYRRLYEGLKDAFVRVDMDGRILEFNEAYRQMVRYESEELRTLTYIDITPERWHAFQARIIQGEVLQRGYSDVYEKEYRRKDGTTVPVELRTILLRDDQGQPCGMWAILRDITARKQAEAALHAAERMLRMLMDASPESILLLDAAGKIVVANETTARRLGRPVSDIVGRTAYDLFPAEVAANRMRHVEEVVRTGQAVRFDDRRFDRQVENALYPILDEQGTVTSVAILGIDQTERKQAEEALKKAHDELEQRVKDRTAELAIFRSFVEASGRGFGMADLEGHITYVNATLCRLFGETKPEDVIGKCVCTYYPEEYRQKRENEIIPTLLREGSWQGEQAILSRNGALIPTFQNTFLIRNENGEPFRLGLSVADISAIKRTEEALRDSEAKYRALVESCPDSVLMVDLQGQIVFASQRTAEQHGFLDSQELVGRSAADLVVAADRDRFRANIARLLKEGVHRNVHYRGLRKDGTTFDAEISSAVICDAAGNPEALMGVYQDITQRRRAEARLRVKDAELLAAAEIQAHLLPQEVPQVPGFDIAGHCYPAEAAAGDHFDYLWLPDGSLLLVMGDVSGHGIGPAIVAADFCARLRTLSENMCDLPEMARKVNAGLYQETAGEKFVTAILGRLDPKSRSLTYVNAGHPAAVVLNSAGEVKARLVSSGLSFAIVPETPYRADHAVELVDGDLVLFYTDGLVEAARPGEPQFGIERALQVVQANQRGTAAEIIAALYRAACQYAGTESPHDDITLILVKVLSPTPQSSSTP